MDKPQTDDFLAQKGDLILVTGATGFIGSRLVAHLVDRGFQNIRCFARPSSALERLETICTAARNRSKIEVITGNLLSREDCATAVAGAVVIFHLAAGRREKSVPDAFLNSVVATRNLMNAAVSQRCLKRFVSVSSFAVYTNRKKPKWRLLDETCPVEKHPEKRGDAYSFAKVKQDEIVMDYGQRYKLPFVIVRPGYVYGPGNEGMTARVGISPFGIFLHLGGSNTIPLTYVDNCAEAIALAGLVPGIEGEVFNVVDDNLPSSRWLLRQYKRNVRRVRSIYLPHSISFALCYAWESYSKWSQGQLPPVYNRCDWYATWAKTRYSNGKVKGRLGWTPRISTAEGVRRHLEACREKESHA